MWSGFPYRSLYQQAHLSPQATQVFDHLNTMNFEGVLEAILHTHVVLDALAVPDTSMRAKMLYHHVRSALFEAVNQDAAHARHFQLRLLRVFSPSALASVVDEAQAHFKRAMLSRQFGLNRNFKRAMLSRQFGLNRN